MSLLFIVLENIALLYIMGTVNYTAELASLNLTMLKGMTGGFAFAEAKLLLRL